MLSRTECNQSHRNAPNSYFIFIDFRRIAIHAGSMSEQVYEYKTECLECGELWVTDVRWTFCPICGVALHMVAARLCDTLPTQKYGGENVLGR